MRSSGRFARDEEDPRVACDDGQTGHDESEDEEELFGRAAVFVLEDRAAPNVGIEPELPPAPSESGHQSGKSPGPSRHHHQD